MITALVIHYLAFKDKINYLVVTPGKHDTGKLSLCKVTFLTLKIYLGTIIDIHLSSCIAVNYTSHGIGPLINTGSKSTFPVKSIFSWNLIAAL